MVSEVQDFRAEFPLVDPETGLATPEFLRFLQQRGGSLIGAEDDAASALTVAQSAQTTANTAQTEVDALETVVAGLGIDDLTDVDTSTTPPTDGQALIWVDANSEWAPGDVASGGGGGVWDILDSADASASSSIDLSFNGADYDLIEIWSLGVITSAACDLRLYMGTGAGPTYDTTGGNYAGSFKWEYGTGSGTLSGSSAKNITPLRYGTINTVSNIGPSYQHNAYARIVGFQSGLKTDVNLKSWFVGSGGPTQMQMWGNYTPTTEVTGLQISPSTGTITSGRFVVLGRRKTASAGGNGQFTLITTLDYSTIASASDDIDITGYDEIRIDLVGVTIGAGEYAFRLSDDGGSTFYSGASDYVRSGFLQSSISETNTSASFGRIGFGSGTNVNGSVLIHNLNQTGINPLWEASTTELVGVLGTGWGHCVKTSGPFDFIRILNVSGNNSTAGKVFILGR